MEGSSGVSEKGASGKVGMGAGPSAMGADAVEVSTAAMRYSDLRRYWILQAGGFSTGRKVTWCII